MRVPELFQKLNFEDVWKAYWNHESDISIYRLRPGAKDYLHDNLSSAWAQLIATPARIAKPWERLAVRRRISVNGEVRYEGLSWDWQKNDFGCLQAYDWALICGTEITPSCIEAYGEINVAAALLNYITQYGFSPEQLLDLLVSHQRILENHQYNLGNRNLLVQHRRILENHQHNLGNLSLVE